MESKNLIHIQYHDTPCGEIVLGSIQGKLCLCDWKNMGHRERNDKRTKRFLKAEYIEDTSDIINETIRELNEYFAGERRNFNLPLLFAGTSFQQSVWNALLTIPYGETRSYKQIARIVGNEKGVRAVAQAIGANPMSIIVPCHRVIGSDKALTGFAGGLEAKRYLLNWEKPAE